MSLLSPSNSSNYRHLITTYVSILPPFKLSFANIEVTYFGDVLTNAQSRQFWELDDVWLRMVMSCPKYFSNSAGSWKMSEYQTSWHSWIGKNIALMSVFMPRAIHIQLERLKHERTPRRLNMFGRSRNMPFAAHRAELAQ